MNSSFQPGLKNTLAIPQNSSETDCNRNLLVTAGENWFHFSEPDLLIEAEFFIIGGSTSGVPFIKFFFEGLGFAFYLAYGIFADLFGFGLAFAK